MNSTQTVSKEELLKYFLFDDTEDVMERLKNFNRLMMKYRSAIREVTTKLEVLNDELSLIYGSRNPIETIQSRIKKPLSIAQKLKRMNVQVTVDNVEACLNDVAGIRVICPFIEDIYNVAEMLAVQDDIRVVTVKDYIKYPKENGYRSYHMIVEVPVFFSKCKELMRVEVQIRTVAMNFWASLEHQIKYKKEIPEQQELIKDLKECADVIAKTDQKMQDLRHRIDNVQ